MSMGYFFPCLLEGVPLNKTISVEIQARENSYFKSAQIEFINYTPPQELAISFAGAHLFRGRLKNAQQKPCGRVSAYYETILNCANIQPTVVLTPWAFNALTWSTFRQATLWSIAVDIGGYPWQHPPYVVFSQRFGTPFPYHFLYDDVIGSAGEIATSYQPPPGWSHLYTIANFDWVLRTAVRLEASKYAPDDLICVRLAYIYTIDPFNNRPATWGHALASALITNNATSYRVIKNAITARDVFQALGGMLNTASNALFIKPIVIKDAGDIIQVLRKFPQNIIIKVGESGQLVGTDVEYIQNTFELTDSVVFDYTLPKPKPIAITMKAEGEGWRYKVEAKDENSCPLATIEINNSDVILENQEDINRLLKHFKLNLQERGYLKCVLLPELDLYHKIRFKGKEFRVVGYTHRITRDYAISEINLVEEVG
jgi:hypothetical protein